MNISTISISILTIGLREDVLSFDNRFIRLESSNQVALLKRKTDRQAVNNMSPTTYSKFGDAYEYIVFYFIG